MKVALLVALLFMSGCTMTGTLNTDNPGREIGIDKNYER